MIIEDNDPVDYSLSANNLKHGDHISVYYDAHPYLTPYGYNPYVYQLEKDGTALLSITENEFNKRVGFIMYDLGVLVLPGTIWYYRTTVMSKK